VISSTGATGFVIDPETVQQAIRATNGSTPMFLLDLAVPRDVDPAARNLRGVVLADLDDLKAHFVELHGRDGGLAAEVERVRAIVAQEVDRFEAWRRSVRLAPLIQALRDRGERIQAAELQRLAPRLADLSDRERRAVEALAQGIVAKLLHDPIVKLKDLSGPGSSDAHARALAELFGLPLPGDESSS
jgi:glutamyl-tRNA reductase